MGKQILFFIALQTVIYTVICWAGWSWALGLHFDLWKLPIIGAGHAVLSLLCGGLHRRLQETGESWVTADSDPE